MGTTTLVSVNRFGTGSGNRLFAWSRRSARTAASWRSRAMRAIWWRTTPTATHDVFVRDLQMGTTTLVSVNRFGTGSGNSSSVSRRRSARTAVSWRSTSGASDLVANDTNGTSDVFVRDLQMGTTTLVSVNRFGTGSGNGSSGRAGRSARMAVSWRSQSDASDLVANDTNGTGDVFVRDLQMGTTTLVSVNRFGTGSGNSSSDGPGDQRGRPLRGVLRALRATWWRTTPTVLLTCSCGICRWGRLRW